MIFSAQSVRRECMTKCDYCGPGVYTGLPGNACENCMNTGLQMLEHPMISPFEERSVHAETGMSYGLSSCGYDVRLDWGVTDLLGNSAPSNMHGTPVRGYAVAPGSMVLAATVERFEIPLHVAMRVLDKSSWVRRGLTVQNTIAEPGWRGHLTLEIVNHSSDWIWLTPGCPIAQVTFETLDEATEQPYPERGKYQDQARGPQPSRQETQPEEK